jgi:hypothetical protein
LAPPELDMGPLVCCLASVPRRLEVPHAVWKVGVKRGALAPPELDVGPPPLNFPAGLLFSMFAAAGILYRSALAPPELDLGPLHCLLPRGGFCQRLAPAPPELSLGTPCICSLGCTLDCWRRGCGERMGLLERSAFAPPELDMGPSSLLSRSCCPSCRILPTCCGWQCSPSLYRGLPQRSSPAFFCGAP